MSTCFIQFKCKVIKQITTIHFLNSVIGIGFKWNELQGKWEEKSSNYSTSLVPLSSVSKYVEKVELTIELD